MALQPLLAHSTELVVMSVPLFACLTLAVTMLITQTRRNRHTKPYAIHGRRRHINMAMPSVPIGDAGIRGIQASTYDRNSSAGSMHHGDVHAGHVPLRKPAEPLDTADAALPFHALIAVAVQQSAA